MTDSMGINEAPAAARVLVVDDEPALLRVYTRTLAAEGYVVVTAENAAAALAAMDAGHFDVVLTDLWMPDMNGLELLRAIRRRDLDVPVILATASPELQTALDAIDEGAMRYLVKPVTTVQLREAVKRGVALHRMSRLKRQALELLEQRSGEPGDLAGARAAFERALPALTMAYQPVVDVVGKTVFGYEALLRPNDPAFASPPLLVAAALRLDRLPELGARVRETAASVAPRLEPGASLLVNLHPRELLDDSLFMTGAPLTRIANRVILEITERSLLDEVPGTHSRIARLRELGFRLAVDDLGAGYAGLNSWAQLEPELVKLDMTLVRDVHRSPTRRSLVKAMIDVCRDLGVLLIAEGVETAEERDVLRELRCPLMQGYLFARPGPAFPEARF